MQTDDNDLRGRFRALADDEAAGAPAFSPARLHSARTLRSRRFSARRLAFAAASLVIAVLTLTVGLVLGTSTGYASGLVAGAHRRDAIAASTAGVSRQLSALRSDLTRTRNNLILLAEKGGFEPASLLAAESEVDSMRANLARIEATLKSSPEEPRPALAILRTIPVRNALTALTCGAVAVAPPPRQKPQGIPVIALPDARVRSSQTFGAVLGIRQGADGKVLVNDPTRHQLKLFDSTLTSATTMLDSVQGADNSYGRFPAALVPYRGDSSLFPDFNARTLLVLDAHGRIVRSIAPVEPNDLGRMFHDASGVDDKGRVIFHGFRRMLSKEFLKEGIFSDSEPILRSDFALRRTDTLGMIARPMVTVSATTPDGKTILHEYALNPLATVDNWSVLSDGSLALIRGHDYHIDWVRSDGSTSSSPKLPFDWRALTPEDKQRISDSTENALHRAMADGSLDNFGLSRLPTNPAEFTPSPGAGARVASRGDGSPANNCGMKCGLDMNTLIPRPSEALAPDKLPDFYPPTRVGTNIADLDGNVWILPTTSKYSTHGELVYDVVNNKGVLVERVRVPLGRIIVGFAKGGVVYMTSGDKASGFVLERTKLPSARP